MKTSLSLLVMSLLVACSGTSSAGIGGGGTAPGADGGPSAPEDESATSSLTQSEQVNDGCPSRPTKQKGTAAAGDACTKAADCKQCRTLYPVGATIFDGMVSCLGSSCEAECASATLP